MAELNDHQQIITTLTTIITVTITTTTPATPTTIPITTTTTPLLLLLLLLLVPPPPLLLLLLLIIIMIMSARNTWKCIRLYEQAGVVFSSTWTRDFEHNYVCIQHRGHLALGSSMDSWSICFLFTYVCIHCVFFVSALLLGDLGRMRSVIVPLPGIFILAYPTEISVNTTRARKCLTWGV